MFSGPVRDWIVAILVLPGCLPIPGFAQTTLTTPLDEQQVRTPAPKEGTTGSGGMPLPSADPRVPLKPSDPNSLESAPGRDRLPGLPETMAVPETAAPVTEFQEFVASSLGRKLPIYGHSLFDRVPTTFAPVDRIPVTDDYVIGPGDEVLIRAWGQIDLDGKLVVDREGEVFLPKVGALAVAGLKYQQLPEFFRTAIGRVFRNFDLTVSLGQLRSIQVFVVGQARHPGNYTVSSLSTLVNALFASGGPSASGSMRRIQLKRNNLVVTEFDFYDLLLRGDKSKDARLLPGDVIYIPPTGPSIAIAGSVNVPAIYELRDGMTLAGAVEMAGGLATTADGQKAVVERIENHGTRRVEEFPLDQQGWVRPLKDGDVIRIFCLSPRFQNAVTLRGNVAHPGRVEWHGGMRLRDLIPNQEALITRAYWSAANAGANADFPRSGMTPTADPTRTAPEINWDYAVIQRLNPQDLTPHLVPFNLGKLVLEGDEQNNLALEPGDTVIIFSQNDIAVPIEKRSTFLRLEGEFRTAGVFRAETGETLRHLVERVGSFTNNGNLIGNTVGRMGRLVQFWFTYWISPQNTLQFTYKHNTVNQRFVPQGGAWRDYSLRHEMYLHSGLYVKSQLQYEHISRYPLLFAGPQRNATAIVELGFIPHKSK
jgi:protein involved in polysaccharide export with SLBB domain